MCPLDYFVCAAPPDKTRVEGHSPFTNFVYKILIPILNTVNQQCQIFFGREIQVDERVLIQVGRIVSYRVMTPDFADYI
jgi:hypothetical protein